MIFKKPTKTQVSNDMNDLYVQAIHIKGSDLIPNIWVGYESSAKKEALLNVE